MAEDTGGPVVVLAEDYDDTREMMRLLLEMKGCRVVEARDGAEAVEAALGLGPDLVLMDLEMPVLDGYEATRRIIAGSGVPVVALSANCSGDRRQRAAEAGCIECHQKPLDFDLIDGLIARHVARR